MDGDKMCSRTFKNLNVHVCPNQNPDGKNLEPQFGLAKSPSHLHLVIKMLPSNLYFT